MSPWAYVLTVAIATGVFSASVSYVRLWHGFSELGMADLVGPLVRYQLVRLGIDCAMCIVAAGLSTLAVARMAGQSPRASLTARAYAMGPLTHLYAWWVMYRFMSAVNPEVPPERYALMGFTLEWGIAWVLIVEAADPLHGLVLDTIALL